MQNKKVEQQGCNGLVEQIESGAFDSARTVQLLEQYLAPMRQQEADQIVLGCTHYGFLSAQITALIGDSVQLVNTSAAIAKQASQVLASGGLLSSTALDGQVEVFTNTSNPDFDGIVSTLWGQSLAPIHHFNE